MAPSEFGNELQSEKVTQEVRGCGTQNVSPGPSNGVTLMWAEISSPGGPPKTCPHQCHKHCQPQRAPSLPGLSSPLCVCRSCSLGAVWGKDPFSGSHAPLIPCPAPWIPPGSAGHGSPALSPFPPAEAERFLIYCEP